MSEGGQGKPPKAKSLRFKQLNKFRSEGAVQGKLSLAEQVVWFQLWSYADKEGFVRLVSYDVIADNTGMNRTTAVRAVKSLRKKRMVKLKKKGTQKTGPNEYRIFAFPQPKKAKETDPQTPESNP